MPAIYANALAGTTTTNPLLIAGTTLDSAALADLPTVAAPDFMYITLDPTGVAGLPEIVKVTAHTASATSCTIVRAQQSTTARQHLTGTIWCHASTKADYDELPFRKLTTTGDILYGSAANTASRLAIGATGALLTVAAGIPAYTGTIAPTAFAPAITWTGATIGSVVAKAVHLPNLLIISGSFSVTAGSGSNTLTIPLPAGYTADVGSAGACVNVTSGSFSPLAIAAGGTSLTSVGASFAVQGYVFQASVMVTT